MPRVRQLHPWQVSPAEAERIQRELAAQVSQEGEVGEVRLVAGVDISAADSQGVARGAVVVLSYPELELVEARVVGQKPGFPYIPGLLSFRESPLILAAYEKLSLLPDLVLVDGQGVAHPRRFGLASHLGLLWERPTIGCAKSRLCGAHGALGAGVGCYTELREGAEVLGAVLRTREAVSPLYVSVGHRIGLAAAIRWTLNCCRGHRLPEPSRLAHLAAGGEIEEGLRQQEAQGKLF